VHPDVLRFCRAELLQQNYFHAVLEACKSVADKVRTLTGQQGDGSTLVDARCTLSAGPRIVFNNLATDWAGDPHEGLVQHLPQPGRARAEGGLGDVAGRRLGHAHVGLDAAPSAG